MTEAKVDDIPAIVENEASSRAAEVARTAAAQIDQAQKDAEAIARAAQQTDLGSRIQSQHEETRAWREQTETRLATMQAETAAALEAQKASILAEFSKALPPPIPVVETPPLVDVGEHEPSLKQPDTTKEKTAEPEKRRRVLL